MRAPDFGHCGNHLSRHPDSVARVVSCHVVGDGAKERASALGLQRVLGLKKYETAWTLLHKFRRAMVRPERDLLTGRVEVDECYIGGLEEGLPGRLNLQKALIVGIPTLGEQRLRARGHVAQKEKEDSIGADATGSPCDLLAQTVADWNPPGSGQP